MKKIIYSDHWGRIVETVRYRGKKGRFISTKYGRRAMKQEKWWIKEIIEQWRIVEGRRTERVMYSSPTKIEKTTYPGAVADSDGHIFDALRTTNLLTEVHKAESATFFIRGFNRQGEYVQLQGAVEHFGEHHQSQQLVMAIESVLEDHGYGDEKYYRTSGELTMHIRGRSTKKPKIGLSETQITVVLR